MEPINPDNNKVKIHSAELLSALKKLNDMLGRELVECMVTSLEHRGIALRDKSKFYSLSEIQEAFNKMFGSDASQLLLQRLKRELSLPGKGGE
jgi:predicted xylose isomerase-like sugar epimerase